MQSNPLVSIMMPVYNGLPLIKASIESILRQTYSNWECIIVDDGSTDGTSEYLDTLPQLDSRFIIHHFEKNMGRPYARQKALELTSGEYVTMLDAGDLMAFERIELQLKEFEKHPEVALVGARMCSFGVKSSIRYVRGDKEYKIREYNQSRQVLHAPSMIIAGRAKLFRYNPQLLYGEDLDFLFRYLENQKFINLQNILYYYSEVDSVDKRKCITTKLLAIKANKMRGNYIAMLISLVKFLIMISLYWFIPLEYILKRRGESLTIDENRCFEDSYLPLISSVMKNQSLTIIV